MRTNPMKQTLNIAILLAMTLLASACGSRQESSPFVRVEGGSFIRNSRPYSYIGTNFWYGPILASEGEGGNYDRLVRELDTLQSLGVENLRVLVGGDGPDGVFSRIEPTLQKEPGVYNDTILTGLDRFLEELGKRDMQAVLYLNNSWEWSGGYGQYLEWAGAGKALIPLVDGYAPFMAQMAQFSVNRKAHCFSSDPAVQDGFIGWLTEAARRIKAIDPNHLVSVGSEGLWGCENDMALLERVTAIPDVDYMTIHIWPYNWSWAHADRLVEDLPDACAKTDEYIAAHLELAKRYGQPVVVEEFGFPRDGFSPERTATTQGRDTYYRHLFAKVGKEIDGANFWGWSGFARPAHVQWERGDDYSGDPAQEAQGLNGVYNDDTTVEIVRQSIQSLHDQGK